MSDNWSFFIHSLALKSKQIVHTVNGSLYFRCKEPQVFMQNICKIKLIHHSWNLQFTWGTIWTSMVLPTIPSIHFWSIDEKINNHRASNNPV